MVTLSIRDLSTYLRCGWKINLTTALLAARDLITSGFVQSMDEVSENCDDIRSPPAKPKLFCGSGHILAMRDSGTWISCGVGHVDCNAGGHPGGGQELRRNCH